MVREICPEDLQQLLELYLHLHETEIPVESEHLRSVWQHIYENPNYHIFVYDVDGKIVSAIVCLVVYNLTHNVRPYILIENVVTHAKYRGKGYASACLARAREIAIQENCYKLMLITGSKEESTLRFY